MKYKPTKVTFLVLLIFIVYGCSTTKKVPPGEYLLTENKFTFTGKEKPMKSQLPDYVRQKPNATMMFGLFPLKLLSYNSVPAKFDTAFMEYYDLTKKRRTQESLDSLLIKHNLDKYVGRSLWFKRFKFSTGAAPVVIDSSLTSFSEENLENFYFDKGYFDAEVTTQMKLDSAAKKGKIDYEITPGEASYIQSYNVEIPDSLINRFYLRMLSRGNSHIKVGERFDMGNFVAEKNAIEEYLQNRGYWNFNHTGDAIEFTADTTYTDKAIDVTLYIPTEAEDSLTAQRKFDRYRYGTINIYPDSDRVGRGGVQPVYYDTIYEGYHFHYADPKMKYRPRFFTDAMVIRDSAIYRLNSDMQTRRNIGKRESVTLTSFDLVPNDSVMIKGEKVLDAYLYFRPQKKYDFFYGVEAAWSEFMNFGLSPRISLLTRNLFRGGESLEVTLRGTLGNVNRRFTDEKGFFNASETAFDAKLTFPYLLFPIRTDKIFPKRFYKQTDIRLGASVQHNIGLGRITYSTGLDYNISFRDTHSHFFSILNTEFVNNLQKDNYFSVFEGDNMIKNNFLDRYYFPYNPAASIPYFNGELSDGQIIAMALGDQEFLDGLSDAGKEYFALFENMNFRRETITQDVLISSFIYQFTLNQNEQRRFKNPWFFRARIELAGNLLNLMNKFVHFKEKPTESGTLTKVVFNVPYSQFVKLDLDFRKYIKLGPESTFATRLFFGIVEPYGNSDFVPFVRSYAAGGANDIRGWAPATLGPGAFPRYHGGEHVFAIDRMKLLWSGEYRFNVIGRLNSALFVDMGNIWGTGKKDDVTNFRFKDFYRQLGIGSGFGFRFDMTYFLLRLDFGYKIHDPSYAEGERWRFKDFNILKPRLAFGINYPF